jgi:hypothetical protein
VILGPDPAQGALVGVHSRRREGDADHPPVEVVVFADEDAAGTRFAAHVPE